MVCHDQELRTESVSCCRRPHYNSVIIIIIINIINHFVFDFLALWRSRLSARVPESQKLKVIG